MVLSRPKTVSGRDTSTGMDTENISGKFTVGNVLFTLSHTAPTPDLNPWERSTLLKVQSVTQSKFIQNY